MAINPVFFLGEHYGQRNLVGYSPWGHKESDTTKHTHTHLILNESILNESKEVKYLE